MSDLKQKRAFIIGSVIAAAGFKSKSSFNAKVVGHGRRTIFRSEVTS